MLKAVAKKVALEGTASAQRAASKREIIECSGSFVTAAKNSSKVNVWVMSSVNNKADDCYTENVAELSLGQLLDHEYSIKALATVKGKILTGDVMGEVFLWEQKNTFISRKLWTKSCTFTPWKDSSLRSPEETSDQMIRYLCFLEEESKFVAGSNNGTIRVWDSSGSAKGRVMQKKDAQSMKVTSKPLAGIQKLPRVKDPNTGEQCLAFTVAARDGRVLSMALSPSKTSRHGKELVIFDMNDYSDLNGDDVKTQNSIYSIAVSEAILPTVNRDGPRPPIIIAGDESGSIHLSSPSWSSDNGLVVSQ